MSSSYRVAFVTDAHVFGGAEQFLQNLIAALPAHVQATLVGTDVQILDRIVGPSDDVDVRVLSGEFVSALRTFRALAPDVIEVNLATLNGSRQMVAAAIASRIPTVLVDHGPAPGLSFRGRGLQRILSYFAAARVSVAAASARDVERYAGLRHGSVEAIRNGVPDPGPCGPPPARSELVIGLVARLDPVKGIDIAIRAIAQVPSVRLQIAGGGDQKDALVELANRLGVSQQIQFLGEVSDPRKIMCSSDIIVIPSRSEGLPLVLLEAMHANRPLIVTDVGSMADVVTDHVTGLVVPPDDVGAMVKAITEYEQDEVLRSVCASNARRFAEENLSARQMANEYDQLFVRIAGLT